MSKIFSIEFQYINKKHCALVSMYKKENKSVYHVQFIDRALKQIFSVEHIRFAENEYINFEFYKDPFAREVFEKLNAAIDRVVSNQFAIIKWLFPSKTNG